MPSIRTSVFRMQLQKETTRAVKSLQKKSTTDTETRVPTWQQKREKLKEELNSLLPYQLALMDKLYTNSKMNQSSGILFKHKH